MRVLVLLGNQVELWETTLALMKLGPSWCPRTTLLTPADLRDRVERSGAGRGHRSLRRGRTIRRCAGTFVRNRGGRSGVGLDALP